MAAIAYPYVGSRVGLGRSLEGRPPTSGKRPLMLVGEQTAVAPGAPGPSATRRLALGRGVVHRLLLRRGLACLAVIGLVVATWVGAGALEGAGGTSRLVRLPGTTRVAGGYAYVVRSGDTLWSIATRLDPVADPRPLVERLVAQLHGTRLTPGAVIVLP